jgi:hypothetical protein
VSHNDSAGSMAAPLFARCVYDSSPKPLPYQLLGGVLVARGFASSGEAGAE